MPRLTRDAINLYHASMDEVEKRLVDGETPRDVSDALSEPLPNVMGVWSILRDEGKVQARNIAAQPPSRATASGAPLVDRGLAHPTAKVRNLAEKARRALDTLSSELASHDASAKARAEVERLEAELAAARARLRNPTALSVAPSIAQPTVRREYQTATCPDCGVVCKSAAGLSAHQRFGNCKGEVA